MEEPQIAQAFWIADRITGYLNATLSPEEYAELFAWLADKDENQQLFNRLLDEQSLNAGHADLVGFNTAVALERVMLRLEKRRSLKLHRNLRAFIAAAVVLITLSAGYFFFNKPAYIDLVPGKNTATLTLANGKKIRLSDAVKGELAKEAGVKIRKTEDGQLVYELAAASKDVLPADAMALVNTLSTAEGEQYQVILPDQTKVWLNASSSIKFPVSFAGLKERKIQLTGEAYFEVSKVFKGLQKERIPFIVVSGKQQLEVLGTHFNVNAYTDEGTIKTTLLEGSVQINSSTVLKPNQQSVLSGDRIDIREVNAENAVAWKNGIFMFNDEPLEEVMRKISRWYGVKVTFEDASLRHLSAYGTISKYSTVSKVLEMMEKTGDMHFKMEERRIIVTK